MRQSAAVESDVHYVVDSQLHQNSGQDICTYIDVSRLHTRNLICDMVLGVYPDLRGTAMAFYYPRTASIHASTAAQQPSSVPPSGGSLPDLLFIIWWIAS